MYATVIQLCSQFGYAEISQLLCDEEELLTEQMLRDAVAGADLSSYSAEEQAAIADAMARAEGSLQQKSIFMDSKIGVRYSLPLPLSAATTAPLAECCLALTRFYLCDDGDNVSETIKDANTHWLEWLSDLADDKTVIQAPRISTGGVENGYHTAIPKGLTDLSSY